MDRLAIERSVWVAAPHQRVWCAITEPEQLEQWYAPGCPWGIPALRVGATVKFYDTDTDIQVATIDVVEPSHQFTLCWQFDPIYPDATLSNTFLLEEENGGTRVTITQMGYESLPDDVRQQQLQQDTGAYTAIAQSLKAYLERTNT